MSSLTFFGSGVGIFALHLGLGQHGFAPPRPAAFAAAAICSKHTLSSECIHGSVIGSSSTWWHLTQQKEGFISGSGSLRLRPLVEAIVDGCQSFCPAT